VQTVVDYFAENHLRKSHPDLSESDIEQLTSGFMSSADGEPIIWAIVFDLTIVTNEKVIYPTPLLLRVALKYQIYATSLKSLIITS